MSANEIFKTEFRGYSKGEVTEYIASLNSQMETLKSELDSAESQLAKCKKELAETQTVTTVRELTEEESEQLRQSVREELEPAIRTSVREELEPVLRREIAAQLEEKYKSVVEQCIREDAEKSEQYREKAQAYDNQRELLADLMIKAKADAAEICNDAQARADKLLGDSFDKFVKMHSDFEEMKKNVLASKSELDKRMQSIQHYLDDFAQYLDFIGRDIENTGDNFKENM